MSEPHPVESMEVVPPSAVAPVVTASERATKPDPNAQTETSPANWLWLNKLDQTFVTVFVAAFLVLVGYHWATLGRWSPDRRLAARQRDRPEDAGENAAVPTRAE